MQRQIYFDNSATTQPYEEVVAAMSEAARELYGNPSSLHSLGFAAEKAMDRARREIARTIGAAGTEICLTSGGTEAINLALFGSLKRNPRLGRKIITTSVEHPAVLRSFEALEKMGYRAVYLPVSAQGELDFDRFAEEVDEETALVSLMQVNNETGAIFPVEQAVRAVKQKNPQTLVHVDAVQSYLKLPIDVNKMGADLLSVSAHKVHGPRGVGFLYVKKGTKLEPILYGGGQMEGLRSGTENLPAIVGFATAAQLGHAALVKAQEQMQKVRDRLLSEILSQVENVVVHSPEGGAPGILNVSFLGVRSEVLLHALDGEGICVSSGSACSSHKPDKSHVLLAMGKSADEVDSALRFSFSARNTEEEAAEAADVIARLVPAFRKVMG